MMMKILRGTVETAVSRDGGEVAEMPKLHPENPAITKSMSEAKNTALGTAAEFGYSEDVPPPP